MSGLIDRYLYDVCRRLPEKMRADVEKELRSHIGDMLPEDASDGDIEKVLTELGSPAQLAARYRPNPRYLISPERFDEYVEVLKTVAIVLAVVLAVVSGALELIENAGNLPAFRLLLNAMANVLGGAVTGLMQAFFWVTLSFACMEYFQLRKKGASWSPKDLPEIPNRDAVKISRGETAAGIVFTILFATLFMTAALRSPSLIGWYEVGKPPVPLFGNQVLSDFLPLFAAMIVFSLLVSVAKLILGRWSPGLAVLQVLYSVASAAVGLVFLHLPQLINSAFTARLAQALSLSQDSVGRYLDISLSVLTVLIIVGTLADIISALVKAAKSR